MPTLKARVVPVMRQMRSRDGRPVKSHEPLRFWRYGPLLFSEWSVSNVLQLALLVWIFALFRTALEVPGDPTRPLTPVDVVEEWRDADEARRRLQVFVYELPSYFNEELVFVSLRNNAIRDPWCDSNFYSADDAIAKYLHGHPVIRTNDSDSADLFWVPIYTTCSLISQQPNDLKRSEQFFRAGMEFVMSEPYWNRSHGHDHVFAFTQGFGARMIGDWLAFANATFLVHNGDYSEPHFRRGQDIVFPPNLARYVPRPCSHPLEKCFPKLKLAFFGGQIINEKVADERGSNHSGGVRQLLYKRFRDEPGFIISRTIRDKKYNLRMTRSVFCLCPEGWHKWSPRPYYAILSDCIPVVISEEQELALPNLIDWNSFAVFVKPNEVESISEVLDSLSRSETDLRRRHRLMREVLPLLHYGHGGLAREAVMHELWIRSCATDKLREWRRKGRSCPSTVESLS